MPAKTAKTKKGKANTEKRTYTGYCVKCKEKGVEFEGTVVEMANGRKMAQGPCPECGTKISRILGKDA